MLAHRPNLFVIGAMKSGTTFLSKLLGFHPSIYMSSPEEPSYFVEPRQLRKLWPDMWDQGYWRSEERYLSLFEKAAGAALLGEASTNYTKLPLVAGVAERIRQFNPDARFIYLIRDPVERTISHYWHMVRYHAEHRPLLAALANDSHLLDVSYYAMQLVPFYELFGRERIEVLTHEELTRYPIETMQALYERLGVGCSGIDTAGFNEPENVTPEVVAMAGYRGLLHKLRQTRPLRVLAPNIPDPLRRLVRRLATKNVDRRSVETLDAVRHIQPLLRQWTAELTHLLGREFPEWTTLYTDLPPVAPAAAAFTGWRRP